MSSQPGIGNRPPVAAWALLFLAAMLSTGAWAAGAAWQDGAALSRQGADWLRQRVAEAHPDAKAEVQVLAPDNRLRLKACGEPAFKLAEGSKTWGQGSLAARCVAPETWEIFLAYRIKLSGPALVGKRALTAHQVLTAGDVESREIDYQRAPGQYLQDIQALQGATLTMPAPAGTPLRLDMLRRPTAVRAGQRVSVLAEGAGFAVRQEAVALQSGAVGDLIRLKTQTGRIIQGTVTDAGQARINP